MQQSNPDYKHTFVITGTWRTQYEGCITSTENTTKIVINYTRRVCMRCIQ